MSQNIVDYSSFVPPYLHHSNTFYAVITDLEGVYVYVNPYFKKRFSDLHDSFIGVNSMETIFVEDHAICIQAIKAAMMNPGKSFFAPLRKPITYDKNQLVQSDWEFTALTNDKNEQIGIMCVGKDASRRRQLLNENYILNNVFQSTEESIYLLNSALEIVQKNKVAETTFKPILNSAHANLYDFFDHTFIDEFTLALNELRAKNEPYKFVYQHKQNLKWYTVRLAALKSDILVSFLDITTEKTATLSVQEKNNYLNAMLESSISGLLILDTNYTIKLVNEKALTYSLLINQVEVRKNSNLKAFASKKHYKIFTENYETALKGTICNHLFHVINSDEEYWFNAVFYPIMNDSNQIIGVTVVIVNATKEKHHESGLVSAYEKLKAQNEQLQKIAWYHSHEVRRPLANIMEINELFSEVNTITELRSYSKLLNTSCKDLDRIIHTIDHLSEESEG